MDEVKVEAEWIPLKPLEKRQQGEDRDGMRIERSWGEMIGSNSIPLSDTITPIITRIQQSINLSSARHSS